MNGLKSFLDIRTVISIALTSVMWLVYSFTDFKAGNSDEGYLSGIIVFFSILISLLGGLYAVARLSESTLKRSTRLVMIFLLSSVSLYFLVQMGLEPKNFLQSEIAIPVIFSGLNIFTLIAFGWREPQNEEWQNKATTHRLFSFL